MTAVSGDLSLFGDDEPTEPPAPVQHEAPIADWQVDRLRTALDARGLVSMEERQRAIEAAAGRPVDSLRSLTLAEGLQILTRLGQSPAPSGSTGSAWDERDEDTWIDRL
jgi:hypothetical protein